MRRFAVPAVITALVLALLMILAVGLAGSQRNNSLDRAIAARRPAAAPDASLAMPVLGKTGTSSTLKAFRGHPVLVNFFASWCVECQTESASLRYAQQKLKAQGGTVLGVTYQDNPPDTVQFVKRYKVGYPVLEGGGGTLANAFGVTGVPESFLVDARGKVVALERYSISNDWVDRALKTAGGSV